jgi:hypothetical protein
MANTIWDQILEGLGISPTSTAAESLALWSQGEGGLTEYVKPGDASSGSINNPFNITAAYGQQAGNTGSQGDIKVFKTIQDGIAATVQWLKTESYLKPVVSALAGGSAQQIYQAINSVANTLDGTPAGTPTNYPPLLSAWASGGGSQASGVYATGQVAPQPVGSTAPISSAANAQGAPAGGGLPGSTTTTIGGTTPPIAGQTPVPPPPGPVEPAAALGPQGMLHAQVGQPGSVQPGQWDYSIFTNQAMQKQAQQLFAQFDADPAKYQTLMSQFLTQYSQYAFLLDIPEFKTILTYGALAQATPDTVMGMLENTNWWKTTNTNARYYEYLYGTDRAEALHMVASQVAAVNRTAAGLGIVLTSQEVNSIALQIAKNNAGSTGTVPDSGYTQDQITRAVTSYADSAYYKQHGTATGGDISTLADNFQKMAGSYLYSMNPAELDSWVQKSMAGDYNQSGFTTGATSAFEQFLKAQAVKNYPWMGEQINEGVTPNQIIAPYANAASQILEIAPTVAQTDLTGNGKLAFALGQKNPKTNQTEPMSVADFRQQLMTDPKYGYQYTNQAQQAAWTTGAELLRSFGAIAGSVT